MIEFSQISELVGALQPGQCFAIAFRDMPEVPAMFRTAGRSEIDEVMRAVMGSSCRILPVKQDDVERYYFFALEKLLDPEGDIRTWVAPDKREYFTQRGDGYWQRQDREQVRITV